MDDTAVSKVRDPSVSMVLEPSSAVRPREKASAKRLEAVPWTRHCIECQEKLEQGLLEEAPK